MRGIKFALIVMLSIGTLLAALGAARSFRQGDDDYVIIGQLTTMKQRRDFFRTLTPERKSALWRKHYTAELVKHPELTAEQKSGGGFGDSYGQYRSIQRQPTGTLRSGFRFSNGG